MKMVCISVGLIWDCCGVLCGVVNVVVLVFGCVVFFGVGIDKV